MSERVAGQPPTAAGRPAAAGRPPTAARRPPTAAALLAVRTPMEIDFVSGGSWFAFTLHAVVSEHGVTQPSDLWIAQGDADPVQLTDGPWADTHPLWSPDGSRLACISDRALAGHHLPYTLVPGGEPALRGELPGIGRATHLVAGRAPAAGRGRGSWLVLPGGIRDIRHRRRVGTRARDPAFEAVRGAAC